MCKTPPASSCYDCRQDEKKAVADWFGRNTQRLFATFVNVKRVKFLSSRLFAQASLATRSHPEANPNTLSLPQQQNGSAMFGPLQSVFIAHEKKENIKAPGQACIPLCEFLPCSSSSAPEKLSSTLDHFIDTFQESDSSSQNLGVQSRPASAPITLEGSSQGWHLQIGLVDD